MEPLLGWQFEDSLFAPSRERGAGGQPVSPCGARLCEPLVRSWRWRGAAGAARRADGYGEGGRSSP